MKRVYPGCTTRARYYPGTPYLPVPPVYPLLHHRDHPCTRSCTTVATLGNLARRTSSSLGNLA